MTLSHYGSKAALLAGAALIALSACSQPAADSAATTTENSMNDTSAPAQDLIARAQEIAAPTPEARPVEIEQLGRTRTDEFAWLRDDNWQEVMREPERSGRGYSRASGSGKRLLHRGDGAADRAGRAPVRRDARPHQGRR
jgi:hypothetical protein